MSKQQTAHLRDETGRIIFTEEMKRTHTILVPMMLPIHFKLLQRVFRSEGYNIEVLTGQSEEIVDIGLKYTHNDTCYPAQLTIGQLMEALINGDYDHERVTLLLMQTGGGCRASNYVNLLRKALQRANLDHIPVLSFNFAGLEKNPGFRLTIPFTRKLAIAVLYGDVLMNLFNQIEPYEITPGITESRVDHWSAHLDDLFFHGYGLSEKEVVQNTKDILADFSTIPTDGEKKVKVGIVGEIYVKFAPLGNNNLEAFLRSENCEVVVPGLMDFILYTIDAGVEDFHLYGTGRIRKMISMQLFKKIIHMQNALINEFAKYDNLTPPTSFLKTKEHAAKVIHTGTKMGEGWLLTGEMVELIESGVHNIVCTQPFGCLPNHIVGRGMMRRLKEVYPHANIVPIDYDASATRVNQENRIKLMLSGAKRNLA